MSPSIYYNIDGEEKKTTPWMCPELGILYSEISEDYRRLFSQSYTYVKMEVPEAIDSSLISIGDYWEKSPIGKTKFSDTRRFRFSYIPRQSTMKLYLDGVEVPFTWYSSRVIIVGEGLSNGYLWGEYQFADITKSSGDNRSTLDTEGVLTEVALSEIDSSTIVRLRKVLNNFEEYLGMPATLWTGGPSNVTRSTPPNIVIGKTPIYMEHLSEIKSALQRVEDKLDTLTAVSIPRYEFSSLDYSNRYNIQYVEEMMEAANDIETVILDPVIFGGA